MKNVMDSLGLTARLLVFEGGQEVVDYVATLLSSEITQTPDQQMEQLACLLITEINLPDLNGNEVVVQIKELFEKKHNLIRPLTCYLTEAEEGVMS